VTEQLVTMRVHLLPLRWHQHDEGRVGDFRGHRSAVVILVIDRGPHAIVWCTCYAPREIRRQVYTEVEPGDVDICAVYTALELLKAVGDEPAEVN
jgi:hypothetical protein